MPQSVPEAYSNLHRILTDKNNWECGGLGASVLLFSQLSWVYMTNVRYINHFITLWYINEKGAIVFLSCCPYRSGRGYSSAVSWQGCLPCFPAVYLHKLRQIYSWTQYSNTVSAIYDISSDVRIVGEAWEKRKERAVGHLWGVTGGPLSVARGIRSRGHLSKANTRTLHLCCINSVYKSRKWRHLLCN